MSENDSKRILKNTVYLYFRLFFSMAVSLYTSRVVLEVLGVDDFGLYSLVGGFVLMLTILTGTFSGTAARFIAYEIGIGNPEKLKRTTSTVINILIFISILVFVVGVILGPHLISEYLNIPAGRIEAACFVFYCSLFVFSMNLLSVPYQALITAYEHMNFYALMSVFESVSKLIVVLLLSHVTFDKLYFYAFMLALISVVSRIMYGVYCNKHFKESRYHLILDKKIFIKMSSFSLWMGIGTASGILKDQGLSIIINLFYGLALNAARGISIQVTSVFTNFASNIGLAISPQITKSYSQGNVERSIKLTFVSAKAQGYLILFIMIPFLLESHYVLTLWLKSFPEYTQEFVFWAMLICFISTIAGAFAPVYLAMGRIRNLQIIGCLISFLYLPVCYWCCSLKMDVIICMQLSFLLHIILFFLSYLYLKVTMTFPFGRFMKQVIIPMVILGMFTYCIVYCIKYVIPDESFIRLMITCFMSSVLLCLSVFGLGINVDEKNLISGIIIKKIGSHNYISRLLCRYRQ